MIGWTAVRWKGRPVRFHGSHFRMLGIALFAPALVVLSAYLTKGEPVPVIFLWV